MGFGLLGVWILAVGFEGSGSGKRIGSGSYVVWVLGPLRVQSRVRIGSTIFIT